MKTLFIALLTSIGLPTFAQYYYKDIIGTKETEMMINAYRNNKVTRVVLNSYDADGTKSDDFFVEQVYAPATQTLRTITRSGVTDESILISIINAKGQVIKTVDSSEALISTTFYNYNDDDLLTSVVISSSDTNRTVMQQEEHRWEYDNGKINRMLRIKNGTDTTYVQFKLDEKGNIVEEQSLHKGVKSDPVYYYYDAQNRLTDIVRYNNKVRRLLPEYMFEYSPANQVIQKITVPANSSDYLIWRYQYDARGLKVKEAVYNKQKQLTGKIEYQYLTAS
ncbi:MAG: hypothetical protein ICV79_14595 [Flavisolibacter sp.]|nr:hypothetical protein [Flavisolibacter sp.]